MAKIALLVLAMVSVTLAKPLGGIGVAHKTAVTSSVVSPWGMWGYPGIGIGHTVSTHSVGHVMPHFGLGMMGMKGLMYPGIGLMGYGLMG